jgi:hypothetical protein
MYPGMLLALCGWALYQPAGLLGPIAFVLFMAGFQIIPEERILRGQSRHPAQACGCRFPDLAFAFWITDL